MGRFAKQVRKWQLRALGRVDAGALLALGGKRLVRQAQHAARRVPAYRTILMERGISAAELTSTQAVLERCPVLEKEDLFGRFALHELCVDGSLAPLAGVLTSSGHGSRFAFGLSTARQGRAATKAVDLGLEHAFQTDSRRTLLINALPMGVRFASSTVAVAETSVREDMVVALLGKVSPYFEQSILVMDPLFCKRLLDYAAMSGLDWTGITAHAILGEETFGEHFRAYVGRRTGQDTEGWTRGFIGSSMGVGELGLNLFFETRETVRLRQLAHRSPAVLADAIGGWPGRTPPILFVYDPRRVFVEVLEPDRAGFGALTVSTLDRDLMAPMIRYKTGDRAALVSPRRLEAALSSAGLAEEMPLPALPMIALAGREKDRLPDGRTLLDIKDALYAEDGVADLVTGAFRVEAETAPVRLHIQLSEGVSEPGPDWTRRLRDRLPSPGPGAEDVIQLWEHSRFPFGQGLDYERKFSYLAGP